MDSKVNLRLNWIKLYKELGHAEKTHFSKNYICTEKVMQKSIGFLSKAFFTVD
ncbi:hypothetical protein [Wolbachia endosymbiont of Oedothorax gibbosus]|uniref:hypothetical protein n=1 Tax=Wolbachia endosymbiont of Oedothorax gibbosus TaxID=931100 RepID=UPI0020241742|nr:hypothetical protein [Wolbachia endosymbiont of Oedothorax gibbosus]